MLHYTYRITNIKLNKHYYGCRSSKVEPKLDLGIKYFSSSKDKLFVQDQKENSLHYKYKIIKIFNTREEAIQLEIKLHNRFNVGINESFYNKSKQTSIGFSTFGIPSKPLNGKENGMYGKTHTLESIAKIRKSRANQQVWNKGKTNVYSYETKLSISNTLTEQRWVKKNGKHIKIHITELAEYLNNGWAQGIIKNDLVICKYCNKEMNIGNHNRWHGNACKLKPAPIDIG